MTEQGTCSASRASGGAPGRRARDRRNIWRWSWGISKKTVQNWEKGLSSPDLFQCLEWFRVLDLNPMTYLMEFIYPESDAGADDDRLTASLTPRQKKSVSYIYTGSPAAQAHGAHAAGPALLERRLGGR